MPGVTTNPPSQSWRMYRTFLVSKRHQADTMTERAVEYRRLIVGTALAIVLTEPLTAQSRDTVSLEITVGASRGWGGRRNYIGEGGLAREITLGIRARPGDESRPEACTWHTAAVKCPLRGLVFNP